MNIDKTQTPGNSNDGVGRLNKLAYRDGYIHSQNLEDDFQDENDSDRNTIRETKIPETNKTARGLLWGITITLFTALLGGTFFLLMHQSQPSPTPVQTSPASENR
jgi:hypothetical protein